MRVPGNRSIPEIVMLTHRDRVAVGRMTELGDI